MKYILSEEEMDALKARKDYLDKVAEKELQELCTLISNTMPITRDWAPNDPPKPWRCYLTERKQGEWYCDKCPVTSICPWPYKNWSK